MNRSLASSSSRALPRRSLGANTPARVPFINPSVLKSRPLRPASPGRAPPGCPCAVASARRQSKSPDASGFASCSQPAPLSGPTQAADMTIQSTCHDALSAGGVNPHVEPVSARIPKPLGRVRRAALARDRAQAAFARSIVDASAAGFSYREIAQHAGVSTSRVGQIVLAARCEQGSGPSTGR
jgi:hypothetical protein